MRFLLSYGFWVTLFILVLAPASQALADYDQRFSVGLGFAQVRNPSGTSFMIGAEYENRFDPAFGIGGMAEYIFSDPGITYLGLPEFFLHPLETDWLISVAPLVEFGSTVGTNLGVRLGTRIPIPLGSISLVPLFAVDIISGGPNYTFGLGIEF